MPLILLIPHEQVMELLNHFIDLTVIVVSTFLLDGWPYFSTCQTRQLALTT